MLSPTQAAKLTVPIENVETDLVARLEEHGCAIVSGVATLEECNFLEHLFAEDLKDVVDVDALRTSGSAVAKVVDDVHAWPLASLEFLGGLERCQIRGLPHGRFAWECRLLPNIRRCFEIIHETDDLVCSLDTSFFAPDVHPEAHLNRSWPHVDQNSNDNRFFDENGVPTGAWEVFQSILYVWSSEDSHASTTVVLPGSHSDIYTQMMEDPYMQKQGRTGVHFSQVESLSQNELKNDMMQQWRIGAKRVPVPKGGLFLWSSKTLHQGWSGGPRLAHPICWEPANRRDEVARDRKLRLAALGLPSTHSASLGVPHSLVKLEPSQATMTRCFSKKFCLSIRPFIHFVSLRDGVDMEEMWTLLKGHPWGSALSAELRQRVLESLSERISSVL